MTIRNMAISENFGDLLDPRFRKIYEATKERLGPSVIPLLFNVVNPGKHSQYKVSAMGGLGDLQDFDGSITYDGPSQLYDTTFTFPEKALGMKVEKKLADDDEFGIMDARPRGLATSVTRTREKKGISFLNEAFTTVHPAGSTGGDGVCLCSASHPYSPDDSTVQSNLGTTALAPASVEATRRIGYTSIYTDRGELADINYDQMVVPVSLEETAWEIINSKGKVDTANNNRNFHEGRYKLLVLPRLTDSNDWFFMDSELTKQYFYWFNRISGDFEQDRDFDTKVAKWSVYERYACGFADWRPLIGHNVS